MNVSIERCSGDSDSQTLPAFAGGVDMGVVSERVSEFDVIHRMGQQAFAPHPVNPDRAA